MTNIFHPACLEREEQQNCLLVSTLGIKFKLKIMVT